VSVFKSLLYLLAEHHEIFLPEVTPVWEALERELAAEVPDVVTTASLLIDRNLSAQATKFLTRYCAAEAVRGLNLGEAMLNSMEARSRLLFGIRADDAWRGPEQLW
jgi:hypothetical protein